MKLTKEIAKAIQECIEDGFESVSEFARFANVSTDMVTKYIRSETESIKADTWRQIQPLLRIKAKKTENQYKVLDLNADQKILLDAFRDLPPEIQRQKLMDIIDTAKRYNRKKAEQLQLEQQQQQQENASSPAPEK